MNDDDVDEMASTVDVTLQDTTIVHCKWCEMCDDVDIVIVILLFA